MSNAPAIRAAKEAARRDLGAAPRPSHRDVGAKEGAALLERAQALLEHVEAMVATVDEKIDSLVGAGGFYKPEQVYELSTLSDTEILRQQRAGSFPLWIHLGPKMRRMPRAWLNRWCWLKARNLEWTPAEQDAFQRLAAIEEERRRPRADARFAAAGRGPKAGRATT